MGHATESFTTKCLAVALLTQLAVADQLQPQCAVNVHNTKETCSALLATTTAECDCYIFCDGQVVSCTGFGVEELFSCVGSTVAGCSKDMFEETDEEEDDSNSLTSLSGVEPDRQEECAVTVNARDDLCSEYMVKLDDTVSCDCYNFCNGNLINCLDFGERTTFSCSGEIVAGCVAEQEFLGADSAGPDTTIVWGVALSLVGMMLV